MRAVAELERGRESYAERRWADAYGSLTASDRAAPLGADDLELLARSAYMLGRDDDYVSGLERAHRGHVDSGEPLRAVRCAWWLGRVCLWEADSVDAVQRYVDTTLGPTSVNTSYEVNAEQAFADRPLGLPETPAVAA